MALLSEAERAALWAEVMRDARLGAIPITKADLRAAVDAADAWVEAAGPSFVSNLPQPARSALNAQQMAMLLMYVVARRFLAG